HHGRCRLRTGRGARGAAGPDRLPDGHATRRSPRVGPRRMAPGRTPVAAGQPSGGTGPPGRRDLVRTEPGDPVDRPGRARPAPLAPPGHGGARSARLVAPSGVCTRLNAIQLRRRTAGHTVRPKTPRGGAMQRRMSVFAVVVAVLAVAVAGFMTIR